MMDGMDGMDGMDNDDDDDTGKLEDPRDESRLDRRPADQKKKALSYEIAKWQTVTAYEKIFDSLQWNHQVDETSDNRIST